MGMGGTMSKIPKPRGKHRNKAHPPTYRTINIAQLQKYMDEGRPGIEAATDGPIVFRARNGVKLLGDGELRSKPNLALQEVSSSAMAKTVNVAAKEDPDAPVMVKPPLSTHRKIMQWKVEFPKGAQ